MNVKLSRRSVLLRGLQIPIGGAALFSLSACDGNDVAALVCAAPSTLTTAEESVRRTLRYVEVSSDAGKTCSACEFFYAPNDAGGCGSCEIFGGKPVNPGGHCDSWSVDA